MSSVMFPCGGSWSILDLLRKEERPLLRFAPKSLFRRGIRGNLGNGGYFLGIGRGSRSSRKWHAASRKESSCYRTVRELEYYCSNILVGSRQITKKGPAGSGAFFIQSEAGASRRLSTCRPCRPCHPCRQAWQERPSWVRAFRRWRIRWSAAGRPRKRRSAGRYGSPSWGR